MGCAVPCIARFMKYGVEENVVDLRWEPETMVLNGQVS